MPTKRIFDLALLTVLLVTPALGLVKMAARRWAAEENNPLATVGAGLVNAL
jgi:hypothetical protein